MKVLVNENELENQTERVQQVFDEANSCYLKQPNTKTKFWEIECSSPYEKLREVDLHEIIDISDLDVLIEEVMRKIKDG